MTLSAVQAWSETMRHAWHMLVQNERFPAEVGLSLILDLYLLMSPLPGHGQNLRPHQKTRGEKQGGQKAPAPGGVGA